MRVKATVFEFTSYQFEPKKKRAIFHYKTDFEGREPIIWTETIILPKAPDYQIPKKLLQSLHIILGISYWKFYCATNISLPYALSKSEAEFWNTVYKKGLGEFLYKNNLNPNISPKFPFGKSAVAASARCQMLDVRCLVGIGGGKDSIVSAELLKQAGFDITAFNVETGKKSQLVDEVIKVMGVGDLRVQRLLDEKVHEKHQYNGHIPISAIYAFLGIFACAAYGYRYFIVSNEHSSNFGSIRYKGLEVNHQWSKSFEFETLFQHYLAEQISPNLGYFSLLRPFYEIRIVKMFAKYKKYFPHFSSCNRNFVTAELRGNSHARLASTASRGRGTTQKLWCGKCAKCIFVWTLLSAFLKKKEMVDIFKKNLYEDQSLLPVFKDILGLGTMKPFDCVGTFEEARTAFSMARKSFHNTFIMRHYSLIRTNKRIVSQVFATQKENTIPDEFKFLGMESAYILRYGIEGKIVKEYLKKEYPKLKIGLETGEGDQLRVKKQLPFDIAVKTPGVKKEFVAIPYTTPTNIFFSHVKGKNVIIGVTGSKGKSTTASLIYHILKTADKDVQLLGNIGKPMLEALVKKQDTRNNNQIYVLELSSFQLDDIHYSPDIAVVTNLFPEHMDFHGNLKKYYQAKKNIINFQTANDYFVYHKKAASWLKGYLGRAIEIPRKNFKTSLIGEHNQSNISAAAAVADILKIPNAITKKAIKSFKGLEHRLEFIGQYHGISFYNDAISTTPDSTIMAIKALQNIGTIFLGGQDRGYNFSQLEKTIKKYNIKNIVLFPDSGPKIIRNKKGLNILHAKTMVQAVKFAYQHTQKGQICLLSCASPSYSLWKNFEEKGNQFKYYVKQLR